MSKKKSLGSSPIGLSTSGTMGFIPNLDQNNPKTSIGEENTANTSPCVSDSKTPSKIEKKTVSYYLDTRLIAKVKTTARDRDLCYSALVSNVLKHGLEKQEE